MDIISLVIGWVTGAFSLVSTLPFETWLVILIVMVCLSIVKARLLGKQDISKWFINRKVGARTLRKLGVDEKSVLNMGLQRMVRDFLVGASTMMNNDLPHGDYARLDETLKLWQRMGYKRPE